MFCLLFVSPLFPPSFQLLLFLIVSPAIAAHHGADTPFNGIDWIATLSFASLLAMETIAGRDRRAMSDGSVGGASERLTVIELAVQSPTWFP